MNRHRKQVVNLKIQPNGKKDYTTFFEGIYNMPEQTDNEFGFELLLNLGNFSSLRIIAKRHGESSENLRDELIDDLLTLKNGFLTKSEELLA